MARILPCRQIKHVSLPLLPALPARLSLTACNDYAESSAGRFAACCFWHVAGMAIQHLTAAWQRAFCIRPMFDLRRNDLNITAIDTIRQSAIDAADACCTTQANPYPPGSAAYDHWLTAYLARAQQLAAEVIA
jgi:hypothetical protein